MPPKKEPAIILGATTFISFQFTAPLAWWEKVEDKELNTITPRELPRTICDKICSGNSRKENM